MSIGMGTSSVRLRREADGSNTLAAGDGIEVPLTEVSITTLALEASAAGLTTSSVIPWDTVIQDDLAVADIAGNPSKIYVPDSIKMIRVSGAAAFVAPVWGTAQAGAASTITLATDASATDSAYVGHHVTIINGTGLGQVREISGYVGATKVATVDRAWTVQPDATSKYMVSNGSYRGILPLFTMNSTGTPSNLIIPAVRQVYSAITPISSGNYEAVLQFSSRLIDVTGWPVAGTVNDNCVELRVLHDYGSGLSIMGTTAYPSFLSVEMYA